MKLYRLEEIRKPTTKKPYKWQACLLDGCKWVVKNKGENSISRDVWIENINSQAALRMGTESETKTGFYHTYFLVRGPWPEQTIEDMNHRFETLESLIDDLAYEIKRMK